MQPLFLSLLNGSLQEALRDIVKDTLWKTSTSRVGGGDRDMGIIGWGQKSTSPQKNIPSGTSTSTIFSYNFISHNNQNK